MEESFEVLEERVRKAVDLVSRLKQRNQSLEADLTKARAGLEEAEKRLRSREKKQGASGEQSKQIDELGREVKTLRDERAEIRLRIAKLVDALEGLE
jgi:predicted  nucleic acid-binding Zn-ribbon protein